MKKKGEEKEEEEEEKREGVSSKWGSQTDRTVKKGIKRYLKDLVILRFFPDNICYILNLFLKVLVQRL